MQEHEESGDLLRKQPCQVEEEQERLHFGQQQLLAAARLITPAPFVRGAETISTAPASHQVASTSEHSDTSLRRDTVLGESEGGSAAWLKGEGLEDANSPWLSSAGGDSLAGFDQWRQEQESRSESPPGHNNAAGVITISSDSDSDNDDSTFCNTSDWQHKIPQEAGLESAEDALIAKHVVGAEHASHDSGSCSGLDTSSGCRTASLSDVAQELRDGEETGGNGQDSERAWQENWPPAKRRKPSADEHQLVKCVKLEGRCMVNYHQVRYHTCLKIMKDLKKVSLSSFRTQEEFLAFKIKRAQKRMADWEFKYIAFQISRGNVPPPDAETSAAEATLPVPAVGHRLQIFYKGLWSTGHVIHYCYSDGEHTILFDGDLVRTMKLTTDIIRELPT